MSYVLIRIAAIAQHGLPCVRVDRRWLLQCGIPAAVRASHLVSCTVADLYTAALLWQPLLCDGAEGGGSFVRTAATRTTAA